MFIGPGNIQVLDCSESDAGAAGLETSASHRNTHSGPDAGAEVEDNIQDRLGKQVGMLLPYLLCMILVKSRSYDKV